MDLETHPLIRVFLVDDHGGARDALEALLQRTPEGDMAAVGGCRRNTSDLPTLVTQAQANVVLVDGVLAPGMSPRESKRQPESSGIEAIKALRQHCGPGLKLVVYTNWPELEDEARLAGADAVLSKAATAAALRALLRHLMQQTSSLAQLSPEKEQFIGLTLHCERQLFELTWTHSSSLPIYLPAGPFAFLHYLALERHREATGWVEQVRTPSDPRYKMLQSEEWRTLAQRYGVTHQGETISANYISQWAALIKKRIGCLYGAAVETALICVPGSRKPQQELSYYTLDHALTKQTIVFMTEGSENGRERR